MKDIYDLELHETLSLTNKPLSATRVPGGWIYSEWIVGEDHATLSNVFVPFHTEFKKKK